MFGTAVLRLVGDLADAPVDAARDSGPQDQSAPCDSGLPPAAHAQSWVPHNARAPDGGAASPRIGTKASPIAGAMLGQEPRAAMQIANALLHLGLGFIAPCRSRKGSAGTENSAAVARFGRELSRKGQMAGSLRTSNPRPTSAGGCAATTWSVPFHQTREGCLPWCKAPPGGRTRGPVRGTWFAAMPNARFVPHRRRCDELKRMVGLDF